MDVLETIHSSILKEEDHTPSKNGVKEGSLSGSISGFGLDELKEFLRVNSIIPLEMAKWNDFSDDYEMIFELPPNEKRDYWTGPLSGSLVYHLKIVSYHFKHFRLKKYLTYTVYYEFDVSDLFEFYVQMMEEKTTSGLSKEERIKLIDKASPIHLYSFIDNQIQKNHIFKQYSLIEIPNKFIWKRKMKDEYRNDPPKRFEEFNGDYYLYPVEEKEMSNYLARLHFEVLPYVADFKIDSTSQDLKMYTRNMNGVLTYYFPKASLIVYQVPSKVPEDMTGMGFDKAGIFQLYYFNDIPNEERLKECVNKLKILLEPLPIASNFLNNELLTIINNHRTPTTLINTLYEFKVALPKTKGNHIQIYEKVDDWIQKLTNPELKKWIYREIFNFSQRKEIEYWKYTFRYSGTYVWKWVRTKDNPTETLQYTPHPKVFKDCKELDFIWFYSFGTTFIDHVDYMEGGFLQQWRNEDNTKFHHFMAIPSQSIPVQWMCSQIVSMQMKNDALVVLTTGGQIQTFPNGTLFSYCTLIPIFETSLKHLQPITTWMINKQK